MGFFSTLFGKNESNDDPVGDIELREVALDLGLQLRRAGRNYIELTGVVAGHRVKAAQSNHRTEVEVSFDSGLRDLSIRRRSANLKTSRVDVATGDVHFDASYRLLLNKSADPQAALAYLTPQRREVIAALGDAVEIDEIEEDELEVTVRAGIGASELRQAIELCVAAAQALDKAGSTPGPAAQTPQDAVVETPQDRILPDS